MSCLSVTITNLSPSLHIGVGRLGGIEASVSRYDIPLSFEISDVFKNNHLKLSCGIVCGLNDFYIKFVTRGTQFVDKNGFVILVKRG